MFSYDERIRGLPATREQVVALHQSINQPHLAIPGKQAGPAQAFILALKGQGGHAVFVYLYLAESTDCAVYHSGRRTLSAEDYPAEEGDALAFVESMGFIMDNMNFRQLPPAEEDALLKTLPVFQRDPKQVQAAAGAAKPAEKPGANPTQALGRLFSSF